MLDIDEVHQEVKAQVHVVVDVDATKVKKQKIKRVRS
jgi:hypothetical protein